MSQFSKASLMPGVKTPENWLEKNRRVAITMTTGGLPISISDFARQTGLVDPRMGCVEGWSFWTGHISSSSSFTDEMCTSHGFHRFSRKSSKQPGFFKRGNWTSSINGGFVRSHYWFPVFSPTHKMANVCPFSGTSFSPVFAHFHRCDGGLALVIFAFPSHGGDDSLPVSLCWSEVPRRGFFEVSFLGWGWLQLDSHGNNMQQSFDHLKEGNSWLRYIKIY